MCNLFKYEVMLNSMTTAKIEFNIFDIEFNMLVLWPYFINQIRFLIIHFLIGDPGVTESASCLIYANPKLALDLCMTY